MDEMHYYVFQVHATTGKMFTLIIPDESVEGRASAFSAVLKHLSDNKINALNISCISDSAIMV